MAPAYAHMSKVEDCLSDEICCIDPAYLQLVCEKQPSMKQLSYEAIYDRISRGVCTRLEFDADELTDRAIGDNVRFYWTDIDGRHINFWWHDCNITAIDNNFVTFRYLYSGRSYQNIGNIISTSTREYIVFEKSGEANDE